MAWKIKLNGTFFIILIFTIVTLAMSVLLIGSEETYAHIFDAQNGKLELPKDHITYAIPLTGEWLFYENQLLTSSSEKTSPGHAVSLPHQWAESYYGTYELTIDGLVPNKCYSLYIHDNSSAFALYLDGSLRASNGHVASDYETEVMEWRPMTISFMPKNDLVTLTLQLSSHHSYPLGFIRHLYIGDSQIIDALVAKNMTNQMILFGGITIISLYNLSLFILNSKEKSSLFFAIFCLVTALRIPLTGERLVNMWLSNLNWYHLWRLLFVLGALMLGSFTYFIESLFKNYYNRRFIIFVKAFTLLAMTIAFILPPRFLGLFDYAFLVVVLIFFTYLMFVLLQAIKHHVPGSTFSFVGIAFILGSIVLDGLMPPGSNPVSIGIFVFLIFQSLVTGEKYSSLAEQNKLLTHVAIRDNMTNLFKKDHFTKLVNAEIFDSQVDTKHNMMFIDIDNFKFINDNYGHDIGDDVIIAIAEKIIRSLRYQDIACRFGGDEFVVWLHDIDETIAQEIAKTILNHILEPIVIDEVSIKVSVSIGLSFYPNDGNTAQNLITISDKRMYTAKSNGKNQYSMI